MRAVDDGSNEIALSSIRKARRVEYSDAESTGGPIDGWVGIVRSIRTNAEGAAYIEVLLPCQVDVALMTWNNAVSDRGDRTMIQDDSPVYGVLAKIKPPAWVRFKGTFVSDKVDYFREASLRERPAMTEPRFLFRFAAMEKL